MDHPDDDVSRARWSIATAAVGGNRRRRGRRPRPAAVLLSDRAGRDPKAEQRHEHAAARREEGVRQSGRAGGEATSHQRRRGAVGVALARLATARERAGRTRGARATSSAAKPCVDAGNEREPGPRPEPGGGMLPPIRRRSHRRGATVRGFRSSLLVGWLWRRDLAFTMILALEDGLPRHVGSRRSPRNRPSSRRKSMSRLRLRRIAL